MNKLTAYAKIPPSIAPLLNYSLEVSVVPGTLGSLWKAITFWKVRYPKFARPEEADCFLLLAFGQELDVVPMSDTFSETILPGRPNEAIATQVELRQKTPNSKHKSAVLAQWEFGETKAVKRGPLIEETFGTRGVYLNTREVLQRMKAYMDEHGYHNPIIVAHPWHLVRCTMVARRLGISPVQAPILHAFLEDHANVWNKNVWVPSDQWQTTALWKWLPYELASRLVFWWRGWI